jgi:hypothetical protein
MCSSGNRIVQFAEKSRGNLEIDIMTAQDVFDMAQAAVYVVAVGLAAVVTTFLTAVWIWSWFR